MRALLLLAGLTGCAAQDYGDFGAFTDQSAEAIGRRAEVIVVATVTGNDEVVGRGICPGAWGERCQVYRLHLAGADRPLPCPLIAIDYRDDNGDGGYFLWNPTILNEEIARWQMRAIRVPRPFCHYTLSSAKRLPA
jgi:hypothetical protein